MHHYPCSYLHIFPLFFFTPLSIRVKKGESILESLLDLWTFVGGEIPQRRCIYQGGEDIFYEKTLFHFVLHYVCFLIFLYGSLSYFSYLCFVVLIALCLCVEHAYILYALCFINCMFIRSFALLSDHCGHFHMIVMCLIKLLICFTSYLLHCILLVTLYLSFYYLLYLESLMCFVQVFQEIGIYVPSSSHVLDLGVSEYCQCS